MIRTYLYMSIFFMLSACNNESSLDAIDNATGSENTTESSLPLNMPLMPNAKILTPLKTRSNGTVSETIFKVVASPKEVNRFYKVELEKRGFMVKEDYADNRALSMGGETDIHRFTMKGSTKLNGTPSSSSLADNETRVLIVGKQQ